MDISYTFGDSIDQVTDAPKSKSAIVKNRLLNYCLTFSLKR
jgi:hypothetical protein